MYAIAFDLVVSDTQKNHPKGISQAYAEIGLILSKYSFWRAQGSLYVTRVRNGFLNQSEISVRSVLKNGQILQK